MYRGKKESKMSRRRFVSNTSAAAAFAAVSNIGAQTNKPITAGDINSYLNSLGAEWVNFEDTVDGFDSGGPTTIVKGIAVGWTPYKSSLEQAADLGCNVFVTHETPYYEHQKKIEHTFYPPEAVEEKRAFIERLGITVIRCHDVWDQYPEIGIPRAWGKFLELGVPVDGGGWLYVYDGKGRRAGEIAQKIAVRTALRGQPGIQFFGDENRPVHRIALGCGAITPMDR